MSNPIRIGDPVQIDETTEVLVLCAVDGEDGWCRDGAGGHVQHRLEDLVRARSRATSMRGYMDWRYPSHLGWEWSK
jgi:hypothetical protein